MSLKKFTLIAISCVALSLALLLFALPKLLAKDVNKVRIQELATQALTMPVRIDGQLNIKWWGGLHLVLDDVLIGEEGQELLVVKQAKIGVAILPLLIGEVRISSLDLEQPVVAIAPSILTNLPSGYFPTLGESLDVQSIERVSFNDAVFEINVDPSQSNFSALDCNLQMHGLEYIRSPAETILRNLSFMSELSCGEFQYNNFKGADLKIEAVAAEGVISLAPVTMQFLGGQGTGSIQVDFSKQVTEYQVNYVLQQLKLQGLLGTLPPAFSATGSLDLTLNLLSQGNNAQELMHSANGTIFLHGAQLTLTGIDLDEKFEKFEFSQNFNMVDAGAFFFAGPLGLLATKGYDFTSLLAQSSGNSEISSLISDWEITDGLAQSVDVAMATNQYRVALQGQLDLVNAQFVDVTMAMIDHDGCSLIQQNVRGSFTQPQIDQPQLLTTLAGPVLKLFQQGAALFTGEPCEVFYSGKVAAPE